MRLKCRLEISGTILPSDPPLSLIGRRISVSIRSIDHKEYDLPMRKVSLKSITTNIPGQAVAQLFEALRYKTEGRGFDSRFCNWNSSLT